MSLLDTLNNPSMMHAAIVHFPIVLFVLAVPVAGLAVALRNQLWIRCLSLVLFAGLTLSCWVAEETGEKAQSKVPAAMEQVIWDQINEHEEMAELLKFAAAAGVLFSLLSLIPHPWFRAGGTLLSLCVALMGAILTALTAHYGGDLVYTHGVGTTLLEKRIAAEKAAQETAAAAGTTAPAPAVDPELVPIRDIVMAEAEAVSFKKDIWPIIETRCLDCHEGPEGDGAYDVTTVASMSKPGEKGGPGIVPGEPDESSIVKYIRGELKPRMPKKKKPMPEEELHLIRLWIAAGAKDDSAEAGAPVTAEPVASEAAEVEPAIVEPAPAPEVIMPVEAPATVEAPAAAPAIEAPAVEALEEAAPLPEPEVMQEASPVVMEVPAAPTPVEEVPATPSAEEVPVEVVESPAAAVQETSVSETMTEATAPVEAVEEPVVVMESAPVEAAPAPAEAAPVETAPAAVENFDPFSKAAVSAPAPAPAIEPVQMEVAPAAEAPAATVEETEFEPEPAAAGE